MIKVSDRMKRAAAQAFLGLAALVFVARAFIPAGFMVDRDPASGAFKITICTGLGAASHSASPSAEAAKLSAFYNDSEAPSPGDGEVCPFVLALADAPPPSNFALLVAPVFSGGGYRKPASRALLRFEARPPLPARGPPILV